MIMHSQNKFQHRTWVEISKNALLKNFRTFRKIVGGGIKIAAVVKANAYGHGLEEVSKIFDKEVDLFAVDSLTEALRLRSPGITKPILVLGYTKEDALEMAIENDISFVIYDKNILSRIASLKYSKKAKVHLKIETGLNRQGVKMLELPALLNIIKKNKMFILVEGVYTHFANVEDTIDPSFAHRQLSDFKRALKLISKSGIKPKYIHCAASAAALLYKDTHFNMTRIGISLYGLWPSKETQIVTNLKGVNVALVPALSWKSIIAQVKKVEAGESVGYGRTWVAPKDTLVAVIPVGYSDGYDRGLSNNSRVLINGQYAPLIGRVAMNMFMADVTEIPSAKKEDVVTLLGSERGKSITADELAERIGTINYEIISRINPLIPRLVVD